MKTPKDPLASSRRRHLQQEREALKEQYGTFFAKVAELMFTHDPVGINFIDNTDEYEPEAGTVIPRLSSCKSAADVTEVLHQEFCRWFGPESAGPEKHYQKLASEIWALAVAVDWPKADSAA